MKQEKNDGSYYSIARWEIPTMALDTKQWLYHAKVGISH